MALGRTRAPLVFVLNVDAFVEPGCVERLAEALTTQREAQVLLPNDVEIREQLQELERSQASSR